MKIQELAEKTGFEFNIDGTAKYECENGNIKNKLLLPFFNCLSGGRFPPSP